LRSAELFREEELLPLSALQHLLFCERQCALIHIEQIWVENVFTVEGRQLHERVDGGSAETRGEVHTARGLPLRSLRLGLSGKADCVEFHRLDGAQEQLEAQADADAGAVLPGLEGRWRPFPVEYKRGIPKSHRADEVQLCAQALCLEEMLGAAVRSGALFYGRTRRRLAVEFDPVLRSLTSDTAERLHALIGSGITPRARREPKCASCSLLDVCMPDALASAAGRYLDDAIRQADRDLP
jgi:CRISPR-associated exonuclease Cas4